jgi:signal-transduction protein with cAMP-binding, CBS, and nucleotidyltransferase domain
MTEAPMSALEAQTVMRYLELFRYPDHVTNNDWVRVLTSFSLFSGVSRRRLRELVRHATFREFAPGETIVARDVPAHSLHVILGGTATTYGESVIRTLHIGDYFGEVGLLDCGPVAATVVAKDELHVMTVPRRSFLRLAQHAPAIPLTMLRDLGARFRRLETQAARS